jgi:hypothetical protein
MNASDTPSDADLLRAAIAAALGPVRTAIPAEVVAYDRTKQTITAQIVIRSRYVDPSTGEAITYRPKPIPNVPVAFPSGGGGSITWPLAAGDPVLLVFADRSTDEWKATAQDDNTPRDPRRFDLSDAVALPGHRAPADPLDATAIDETALVIAADEIKLGASTATQYAARADRVAARLAALEAAHNAHVHLYTLPAIPAAPGPTAPTTAPISPVTTAADVATDRVKAL